MIALITKFGITIGSLVVAFNSSKEPIQFAEDNRCQISLQMPPPIIKSNATTSHITYPADPFQIDAGFVTAGNHVAADGARRPEDTGGAATVSSGGESSQRRETVEPTDCSNP
jgi:hypothetical protein